MKVAQLAHFLDKIMAGLDGIVGVPAAKEMQSFQTALQPFAAASVSEFTAFLAQFGAEFQKTGTISATGKIVTKKISKPPQADNSQLIASAVASIRALYDEIDLGTVDDYRVEQVLQGVGDLKSDDLKKVLIGLDIAEKPKSKPKMLDKIRQTIRHQIESHDRSHQMDSHHGSAAVGASRAGFEPIAVGS